MGQAAVVEAALDEIGADQVAGVPERPSEKACRRWRASWASISRA
jgi:hypothetical protein